MLDRLLGRARARDLGFRQMDDDLERRDGTYLARGGENVFLGVAVEILFVERRRIERIEQLRDEREPQLDQRNAVLRAVEALGLPLRQAAINSLIRGQSFCPSRPVSS